MYLNVTQTQNFSKPDISTTTSHPSIKQLPFDSSHQDEPTDFFVREKTNFIATFIKMNVNSASDEANSFNLEQLRSPMNQMQLQQLLYSLGQQVQQHSSVFQELNELKQAYEELDTKFKTLTREHDAALKKIAEYESKKIAPSAGPAQNSSVSEPSFAAVAARNAGQKRKSSPPSAPSIKKRIAAARAFKTVEDRGPQGFEYVYVGRSRKISRGEVRSRLRRAGVEVGRVIDICFPASGVIGLLIHIQYKDALLECLKTVGASVFEDFEPTSPKNLADPKFAALSQDAREQEMAILVHDRCMQTLKYVRPVLVSSVGKYFVDAGWIDDAALAKAVRRAARRLAKESPRRAAFTFSSVPLGDSSSEDEHGSSSSDSDMEQ